MKVTINESSVVLERGAFRHPLDVLVSQARQAGATDADLANVIGALRREPASEHYRRPPAGPGGHVVDDPLTPREVRTLGAHLRQIIRMAKQTNEEA